MEEMVQDTTITNEVAEVVTPAAPVTTQRKKAAKPVNNERTLKARIKELEADNDALRAKLEHLDSIAKNAFEGRKIALDENADLINQVNRKLTFINQLTQTYAQSVRMAMEVK